MDDLVLTLLGLNDSTTRSALREELYYQITTLYRHLRVAEKQMQRNRGITARGGRATAASLAEEIWDSIERPTFTSVNNLIPSGAKTSTLLIPQGKAQLVRATLFSVESVQVGDLLLELGDPQRCRFVKAVADSGVYGSITVPKDAEICRRVLIEYDEQVSTVNALFSSKAAEYSADEDMQTNIARELWKKIRT